MHVSPRLTLGWRTIHRSSAAAKTKAKPDPHPKPDPNFTPNSRTVQDVPIADAKPEEIQDLLGGALFRALYKWMVDTGPVYLLPTGSRLPCPACCVYFCHSRLSEVKRTSQRRGGLDDGAGLWP